MAKPSFGITQNVFFLRRNRLFRFSNLFFILVFAVIGIYAKIGGGTRGHTVSVLFADFFSERFPFYGVFTSASDVLWCVAAIVCWFTYVNLNAHITSQAYKRFLLSSSLLLSCFLIDDLFRLTLAFKVYLNIPKLFSYLIYGALAFLYGWVHRKYLAKTNYLLLVIGLVLLAISGTADIANLPGMGTPAILEDGTKLLAILNICIFFWTECHSAFAETLASSPKK